MNQAQQLILECLAEEAAEVIQAKSKCVRFGMDDFHPKEPGKTNEQLLIEEALDFMVCLEALEIDPYVWGEHIENHKQQKRQKLVNRHPLVFGPIFNMQPDSPMKTIEQQYDDLGNPKFDPGVVDDKPKKNEPGDVCYGGITGRRYRAIKFGNDVHWKLDE